MTTPIKQRIAENEDSVHSLALGVTALGDLLSSLDPASGMSDKTLRSLGYLIQEVGKSMTQKLDENNRLDLEEGMKKLRGSREH
ncbi:hypothetical protein [Oceanimonas doudoroffii]|uniref:Uncharacterized protein n=1 Tax=Oceanimonas doudoroffii TaxID=84158 RepID=A0A233RJD3_9GAMM|nr:hypothetical protein [Oceanimonas doudoroffii]OXY83505.1 hypothetical protein B6S08_08480 [Oceanimonas doudoroffii]